MISSIQSFLAFDFGTRRLGVASGNSLLRQAEGIGTIDLKAEARWAEIQRMIQEWRPHAVVVGVPFHPDGAEHKNTRRARQFAQELRQRFALVVHEVDERYSTTEALSRGARDLDAEAAAIILTQYLQSLPDHFSGV